MKVTLVVGMASNGVIGRDGGLPWRLSTDMKRFKATTMGKPVLMGRKTWDSLPRRPLPGRRNVVVTRDEAWRGEGAEMAHSLPDALDLLAGEEEVCVIGGGQVYNHALPLADRLDVTHVLAEIEGDTRFPAIDPQIWQVVSSEDYPAGENDSHPTRHVIYERRGSS